MSRKLFQTLDRVQEAWPLGARLLCFPLAAPPLYALDAARATVMAWSQTEYHEHRRQLPALAAMLSALYQRLVVATLLALLLGLVVAASAAGAGALSETQLAVLFTVVSTILLPPVAICNGIARDYVAARALLAVCSGVAAQPARR